MYQTANAIATEVEQDLENWNLMDLFFTLQGSDYGGLKVTIGGKINE